jgi:hypothetical protein
MEGLSSAPTKQTIPSQAASAIGSLGTSA